MLIKVEHLKKQYGDITPIKDISCEINKGDIISIIGPSGTGKSTFINCINGLEKPTSGKIFYNNIEITDNKSDMCEIRKKIGMVFQSFNLFSHLTIIENLMLAPVELLKIDKKTAYDNGVKLLSSVGLKDKALSYPNELSGGQQQRAAIARAIAMNPEVILFDEPTSALDPTTIGEVVSVIRDLAKKGFTMIIVTHEMSFAKTISNRVFYLDEGTIYEEGTPDVIFDNPKKEKTIKFINHKKIFNYHISSKGFDYLNMITEIENFAYNNDISKKDALSLSYLAEEMCVTNIMPILNDNSYIDFSYKVEKDNITFNIKYNGNEYNPIKDDSTLSMKIINEFADGLCYSYDSSNSINIISGTISH